MSTIPHTYFRYAKVLVLVYSIDEVESFDSLTSWVQNAMSARASSGQQLFTVALVGNKIDLEKERKVTKTRVNAFAELNDISSDMIFEVSALEDSNVQEMFDAIALKISPYVAEVSPPKVGSGKKKCC